MDISPELKKRFAQDCALPIDIFTEPVFTSRIELFDRFYNTIERYNVFLQMLKERYTTYEMESHTTVTTYRKGQCTITAQSKSNPDIRADCQVKILDDTDTSKIESITLDKQKVYLAVGSSQQLYVSILPITVDDKRVLWGTSDRSEVMVSGGAITGLTKTKEGVPCIITAMSNKDKSKIATCEVYVVDPTDLTGLNFEYHQTELEIGATERLKVNAVPAEATNSALTWTSSNSAVATVVDGVVTALSAGWCTITVSNANLRDVCYVLVHDIVSVGQVILDSTALDMIVGGFIKIGYTILPEQATNKNVTWSSSNTSVLTVDRDTGVITAVGRGQATIRATSVSDPHKYGECVITVNPSLNVRSIEITPTTMEISKEQTFDITSVVSVGYGVDPSVLWSSSYEMLATVTNDASAEATQKSTTVHAQDYYNEFGRVKEKLVTYIKTASGYDGNRGFTSQNVEKDWPIGCTCLNSSIYTPNMDGHTMISITIQKGKFTPLYHYDPSIFNNLGAWENVVSTIGETDNDHIIYSENLLNEVASCCNLSRIEAYGRHILSNFYSDRVIPLIDALGKDSNGQAMASMVYFGTDEIVIDTSKLTRVVNLSNNPEKILCTNRLIKLFDDIRSRANTFSTTFPMTVRLFTLHKLKTEYTDEDGNTIIDSTEIDGYVKNIYFEGNQPLEFVNYDICQLPMLVRAMSYQEIQENDRKFVHQGLVASFTDDRKIHVPPISSIPDIPSDNNEVKS